MLDLQAGDCVESLQWQGTRGRITRVDGRRVYVHWDATSFEDESTVGCVRVVVGR